MKRKLVAKNVLTSIIFALVVTGCSASWHIKTAMRKDPSLFKKDTVVRVDTIWREVVKIDTLFKYKFDTVEFWKDSIYVKYHYSYIDSLVYLEIDCPDSEVITKTNTITETITIKPTFWEKVQQAVYGVVILTLMYLAVRIFKRLRGG